MFIASRRDDDSQYLDQQPELSDILKSWFKSLTIDAAKWVAFDEATLEELECRSRDGFIRASHNFGGFDYVYLSDVSACCGSGCGPSLKEIDRQIDQAYKEAAEELKRRHPETLKSLEPSDISYHGLSQHPELAEELSQIESDWMDSPVWFGVRAMYEGKVEGTHCLMVYCGGNVDQYHGAFGKGSETFGQYEIRFKTAKGLVRQLQRIKRKVESHF